MSNQYNGDALGPVKLSDCFYDLCASTWIQHGSRLIENYGLGDHGHGTCYGHSLLLSAAESVGRLHTIRLHAYGFQGFIDSVPYFSCWDANVLRSEAYILLYYRCNNLIVGILKHHSCFFSYVPQFLIIFCVPGAYQHGALRRQIKTVYKLCKGGFT